MKKDRWAGLYLGFIVVYVTWVAYTVLQNQFATSVLVWFPLSVLAAFVETLVLGLTPNDKWDARHNPLTLEPS